MVAENKTRLLAVVLNRSGKYPPCDQINMTQTYSRVFKVIEYIEETLLPGTLFIEIFRKYAGSGL